METANSRANVPPVPSLRRGPWAEWWRRNRIAACSIPLGLWISLGSYGMAGTPADDFKKFLSEPTAHGSITYSVIFPNGTTHYCRYAWHDPSFVVLQASDRDGLHPDAPSFDQTLRAGRDGDQHWSVHSNPFSGMNLLTWDSVEDKDFPTNAVTLKAQSLLFNPKTLLCMGVPHLEPGSLRWEGNDFHARRHEEWWDGTLSTDAAGRPASMRLTWARDAVRRFHITFHYDDSRKRDVPEWIPDTIQRALVEAGDRQRKLERYSVLELSLSPPDHPFDAEHFLRSQTVLRGIVRSNEIYLSRQGEMRRLGRPDEAPAFNNAPDRVSKPFVYLVLILIMLAPLWFVFKAARGR